jgi:predicted membrane protein
MAEDRSGFLNMRLIIGLLIIAVGVIAILVNLGYKVDINLWDYWPLILILIGLSRIFQPPEYRNLWFGLAFTGVGLLLLLDNFHIIHFGHKLVWPIILILIGAAILRHGYDRSKNLASESDYIDHSVFLGGGEYRYTSKSLKGGKLFALMGGCEVDLRESDIQDEEIMIDTFTIMGGIEIKVPENWHVTMRGLPLMGGFGDKTSGGRGDREATTPVKKLLVKGTAIMGGVEIKN